MHPPCRRFPCGARGPLRDVLGATPRVHPPAPPLPRHTSTGRVEVTQLTMLRVAAGAGLHLCSTIWRMLPLRVGGQASLTFSGKLSEAHAVSEVHFVHHENVAVRRG